MPVYGMLQVEACRELIRTLFLKTIIRAKGLSELSSVIDEIILPTPSSVMEALKLLSKGTKDEPGLGDLMAIDIGGATTDVYSMNEKFIIKDNVTYKGLKEPLEKRSVEGDLGVRFNASNVYELKKDEVDQPEELESYIALIKEDIHCDIHPNCDALLAEWCTDIASERHAGYIETAYTPAGITYIQHGKDLTDVSVIIGIGGPLVHSKDPTKILMNALSKKHQSEILLPKQLEAYLDKNYVVSCLGLLASRHPQPILRLLKRNVVKIV
jgi:uncharacterized protein (TIGR01319 family)